MYTIRYTEQATKHLLRLRASEPKAYAKVQVLLTELAEHPRTGTGHPEPLRGDKGGSWTAVSAKSIDLSMKYMKKGHCAYPHCLRPLRRQIKEQNSTPLTQISNPLSPIPY